jgi:transposase
MAAPLSMDLRQRMVDAVEGGESRNAVAKRFRVGVSTVVRLMQRYRLTGSPAPGQMGGWKRHALAEHEARVRAEIAAHPDVTLEELQDALARDDIRVSRSAVDRFLRACKLTLKKSRSTPPSKAGRMWRPRGRLGVIGNRR